MNSQPTRTPNQIWVGRMFVHPLFDYLLIGGGLSLLLVGWIIYLGGDRKFLANVTDPGKLAVLFLLSNAAHFAASTVRLYTKPGAYRALPFLTYTFPLVSVAAMSLAVAFPQLLGRHLFALYLTWSPYHYAAQTYGLAVMYCYRSGCMLTVVEKRLVYWTCLVPFFYNILTTESAGVRWLLSLVSVDLSANAPMLMQLLSALQFLYLIAPVALFVFLWRNRDGSMPLISLLLLFANGFWWFVFPTYQAFIWATIFHGIQYLAIVIIFHVRDQVQRPDNRLPAVIHGLLFYAMCVPLGYALFQLLPWFYQWIGFERVESVLLVTAIINLHHFIVDAYIWRLKSSDSNRKIVDT